MNSAPKQLGRRKLYTTAEVARQLKINPPALRAHIHTGTISTPHTKLGQSYLWTHPEMVAAMRALNVPGRRKPRRTADANDLGENGSN